MTIINLDKGEPYQMPADTQLEVERTNPFFNEYGEQTVPLSLPATPHNCRLLNHPEQPGNREKSQPVSVLLQDGEYCAECRQYVLSAKQDSTIETNFYLNDGSFYSRIQDQRLKDVFTSPADTISFDGIDEAIGYMRKLRANDDPRLAVFPVLVTSDTGDDYGYNYKVINGWGTKGDTYYPFDYDSTLNSSDFYNSRPRTEKVNGSVIDIAAGYYMSPFVRANYVLKRAIAHYGYTLADNFLFNTEPFSTMVLLNTCIDTIVNSSISLADIVPDVAVTDLINLYRRKFCCEFVANESERTIEMVFFRDLADAPIDYDLSSALVGRATYEYKLPKDYTRLVLKPKDRLDSQLERQYDDILTLTNANPTARLGYDGAIYKIGYSVITMGNTVETKVAEASMDYNTGEADKEANEVEIPETMPEFRTLIYTDPDNPDLLADKQGQWLYVGDYSTLNSKLVLKNQEQTQNSQPADQQRLMLAAPYTDPTGRARGTIGCYLDTEGWINDIDSPDARAFDYALHYYGKRGIYETFWRGYDTLLRNALHKTRADMLLTQSQKQNLPPCAKVAVNGVAYMFDKLRFTLGAQGQPAESELLTVVPSTPTDNAPKPEEMFRTSKDYYWKLVTQVSETTKDDFDGAADHDNTKVVIYPPLPTADMVGQKYGYNCAHLEGGGYVGLKLLPYDYTLLEWWLECCPL